MTTKTVHRIPADKVVVEDDRKIIYIPVEPQPIFLNQFWYCKVRRVETHDIPFTDQLIAIMNDNCPFHPDDTLILEGDNLLSYDHEFTVGKVLGAEERKANIIKLSQYFNGEPLLAKFGSDTWHWKLLVAVK